MRKSLYWLGFSINLYAITACTDTTSTTTQIHVDIPALSATISTPLHLNLGQGVELRIHLNDAEGHPQAEKVLQVRSKIGNYIGDETPITNAMGDAYVMILANKQGTDTLQIQDQQGSQREIVIQVEKSQATTDSNNTHVIPPPASGLHVEVPNLRGWGQISIIQTSLGDNVELQVNYLNDKGEPESGQVLQLSSRQGNHLSDNQITTDHNGQAEAVFLATIVGRDVLTISTPEQDKTAKLYFNIQDLDQENTPLLPIEPLTEQAGIVSWKTLSQVQIEDTQIRFNPDIQALNTKTITIEGFMTPLENNEIQKHFLLSALPPTCFYCLPDSNEGIIEIHSMDGIPYTFRPLRLQGIFNLTPNNDSGFFYQLDHAQRLPR
ncbi:hypothetical protein BegalDRAFT_3470 [Beggiatoa alba B18LD]|uniref:Big-1 domain-containing protein n=1 Tax=Beggiatoa alba B18LD TaxID=395493 RepID=I3CKZ1_9GAMM|nr:hypothetical protein [Beggiatoa alba]EIJ44284.1 hypothetical protein BegalDRAFT_3470 [Beggiatoa alba B18LD]